MTQQYGTVHVIKLGGRIIEDSAALEGVLDAVAGLNEAAILVHGGGDEASAVARMLGIEPVMVDGRRVTDAAMLDVAVMVYAGRVGKRLVAALVARGVRALGLTGADGDVLRARRRPVGTVDYGFVGDVTGVNTDLLGALLREGLLPVLAPLTHDGSGQLLNTNADTIAAEVCVALAATYDVHAYFCLDRPGVCLDAERPASVLPVIDTRRYAELVASGAISGGMLPKLRNAFAAHAAGARRVLLLRADALPAALAGASCVCTELRS